MDYLQKQRRFGGGHLWTTVGAGILFLTYVKYKESKDRVVTPIDDKDEDGNTLFEADSKEGTFVCGAQRIAQEMRQFCQDNSRETAFGLCTFVMGVWFKRSYGTFNRVMVNRYSDVHYQIQRPDMMQRKLSAIKYLVLPGTIVPLFGASCLVSFYGRHQDRESVLDLDADARLRNFVSSLSAGGHYVFDDKVAQLQESSLAQFARNSKQIKAGFF